ncbi:Holliday junction ATP-dependent DNA helicase RuvA [Fructobacillus pseudoficulneus]|uniref:Holliday junction branch migration complex subunit RuvA n=1 Tax=Fructobacillus pseudoficulneus TaxID=220714 RepID=A0A3F3H284_9LACO|nr:Holliday junction branch migration protein RuvA [Fructobacillus pseudoficulneus]GAP02300.1 Holliday junction ATP-dependent DNA helicase RuvA [Fructobacillus pseudoficulneus]SEH36324.1 Holliday junction DNA helicase subunit RuvA [Fructobacillus pseudoficulneus]
MFEYLKGLITDVRPGYIVLESKDGVGYKIFPANPYHFVVDQSATVYVEQIVRETEQALYGFATLTEKGLFNKLLNVSGIGPKSALAILAGADPASLVAAIDQDEVTYLTQFPGVGKKTAQQIILDLKGKMGDFANLAEGAEAQLAGEKKTLTAADNQNLADALAALEALGYAQKDITKVKKALAGVNAATEDLISQALALLVS